jgi:hypothetical protein
MQLHGMSPKETQRLVNWYWGNIPKDAWAIIAAWDDKARDAAREITESIKDFSDKDKKAQFADKWNDWLKENPPPNEVDDINRYQLSQGKKPVNWEEVAKWDLPKLDDIEKYKDFDFSKIMDPKVYEYYKKLEEDDDDDK